MSKPMSVEERYAKVREGVVALSLIQRRGPDLLVEGFLREGSQGGEALEHLRDVLHDVAEQYGVQAAFCVRCGGLVSSAGDGGPEEIEDEAHADCPDPERGGETRCSPSP